MPTRETRAVHWRIVDRVTGAAWLQGAYFREEAKAKEVCERLRADNPDLFVQMVTSPTKAVDKQGN